MTAAVTVLGCSKEEAKPEVKPPPSAVTKPALSAPPPAPTPSATAKKLREDCPQGSSGEGTFDSPCQASGTTRMMEVEWTKKIDPEGPKFKVINKSPSVILYGKIAVYFYDKAGKQLEVKDSSGKGHPYRTCGGNNMFAGVMKAAEKAYFHFSCAKKEDVPEGAKTIEAEMQAVGFADKTEQKTDLYWRNENLTPDERPKGGVK
jgi:hypothetical protein